MGRWIALRVSAPEVAFGDVLDGPEGDSLLSTLTKICVVVLAVLVLFACPIFIQHALTGPNWRQAYLNEQARRTLADAKARNEELAAGVWRNLYRDEKRKNEDLTMQIQSEAEAKREVIARLSQVLAEREATIRELTAIKAGLQNALNQAIALNKAQGDELGKQRRDNITLADQLRRTTDKNNELLSDVELLTRTGQVLKTQLAEREGEIKDLRLEYQRLKQVAATVVAKKPPVIGPKVEGSVTAVRSDIASLNVGSASGVKKGMEFILYRETEFVAHLQIEYVDTTTCSGIIVDAQRVVKVGDKASTSLE